MTLTHTLLIALAALGLSLVISACARPQPMGEGIWRGVQHIQEKR